MHTQLRTQGTSPWCQGAHRVTWDTSEPGDPVALPEGRCGSSPAQLWHWERADVCLCVCTVPPSKHPPQKTEHYIEVVGLWGNTVHWVHLKDKENQKAFSLLIQPPQMPFLLLKGVLVLYMELLMISKDFLLEMKARDGLSAPVPWSFRNGAIKTFLTAQMAPGNTSVPWSTQKFRVWGAAGASLLINMIVFWQK